jgi:myosin heavy subunit
MGERTDGAPLFVGAAAWIPAACTQARYQAPSELMFGNGKPSWLPVSILSFEADGNSAIFALEWDPSIKIKTFLKDTHSRQKSENCEDLSTMKFVNEGAVMQNLTRRFVENDFFTSLGRSVYVSVNPIHRLVRSAGGHHSSTATIYAYLDRAKKAPHVYHAADALYRAVVEDMRSQTAVMRGMSGSGKTECLKHIAQFMITADLHRHAQETEFPSYEPLGTSQNPFLCNGSPVSRGVSAWLAVLELFGTAQTERNENSSRHSKLLRFHYGQGKKREHVDLVWFYMLLYF